MQLQTERESPKVALVYWSQFLRCAMEKTFRSLFFRIDSSQSPIGFVEMLRHIWSKPEDARTVEVYDSPVRLVHLESIDSDTVGGDVECVQMWNFPSKSKLQGGSDDLELDDDEGLGHRSAFIYKVSTGILVYQNNVTGVGAKRFGDYLGIMCGGDLPGARVSVNPVVLEPEVHAQNIPEDAAFRKLIFTVTDPAAVAATLAEIDPNSAPIASTVLRAGAGANPVKMTVTLSVGQSRDRELEHSPR